jgi:hypothetical protein
MNKPKRKSNYVKVEPPKKCLDCSKPPRKRISKIGRHPERCEGCQEEHQRKAWVRYSAAYQAKLKKKGGAKAEGKKPKKLKAMKKGKSAKKKVKTKKAEAKKPQPLICHPPPEAVAV